jgi:hypothetical protein
MSVRGNRRGRRSGQNKSDSVGAYFGDAWDLAKRTATGLNEIRKLSLVERKYKEASASATYDRTTGTVVYLSGLDQGDNTITREGNSIKIQHFRLRYSLVHNASDTTGVTHRILVVRDLQNQGSAPGVGDIFDSGTLATSRAPLAFINFVNGSLQNKRFSIMYDKVHTTHPYKPIVADTWDSNHDCHVYFRGTDNSINSAGNGSYFLVAISSPTTNLPTILYNTRLEFTDN